MLYLYNIVDAAVNRSAVKRSDFEIDYAVIDLVHLS